jgi:antirestriction protein ArdC
MNDNKPFQSNTANTFKIISDHAIALLEKGIVPSQQPWNPYGLPRNISSGYIYTEWNAVFLNSITLINKYKTPLFLTWKQATDMGGHIRRGEKGYPVAFWQKIDNKYRSIGAPGENDTVYNRSRMICITYWVFNIDQTENIAFDMPIPAVQKTIVEKNDSCQRLLDGMANCPPIRQGEDFPAYVPSLDFIKIRSIDEFESIDHYYSHLFHLLAFSTGHHCRLNRKDFVDNEDCKQPVTAKEALTAEIVTAMLCAITGIVLHPVATISYDQDYWCTHIKEDKSLILKASSQARAAFDYILFTKPSDHTSTSDRPSAGVATAS